MKRIMFIIFCLIYGWTTIYSHEETYTIETCGGDAIYKKVGTSTWQAVHSDLVLFSNDSICLKGEGYVTIEYRNHSYLFKSPRLEKIYNIVQEKKKEDSKRYTKNSFLREIGANESKQTPFQMQQLGIGDGRGQGKDTIDYEILAATLASIGALVCTETESPQIKGISFEQFNVDEKGLNFEYSNSSGKDYYINVLHVNKRTNKISLCYVIMPNGQKCGCPITPNGYVSCNREIYFPDTPDDIYFLMALDYPYNSYELDNELVYHTINMANNKVDIHIKYMW